MTCALVPLIPNDDTPARRGRSARRPRRGLGQQPHRPGGPVHVRGRLVDVQGRRQHPVPHRQHHLDHAGHPGRGLGVADVRLDRPQPQRPVRRPVLAVGGQQRLRLDRVAQRGAGAVRLDHVDLGGRQPGVGQRLPDHPLLGRPVRRGQAVGRAVLVDRASRAPPPAPRWPCRSGVGEPLQQQHADALGPARAVGAGREGLAPPVRRPARAAG